MIVFLFRPSPQVPKPSTRAAILCYDASAHNIRAQNYQMDNPTVDITWIFLQSLFMALNTLLWTTSYSQIRDLHSLEELEELVKIAISIIVRCTERWPGSASAAQLYTKLAKACLKSYTMSDMVHSSSSLSANSPASLTDAASPQSEISNATTGSLAYNQKPIKMEPAPQFGNVFDQVPDAFAANEYHNFMPPPPPAFRSNSIFMNPATRPTTDRRFSYFPPESTQQLQPPTSWGPISLPSPAPSFHVTTSPPPMSSANIMNETSYFINQPYNFAPQLYEQNFEMQDRNGSLSYQQQQELMNSLENDGLDGIDSYLNLTPSTYFQQANT
jgi:hypothetical protein